MSDRTDLTTDVLLAALPVHEGYKVLGGVVLYQKLGQGGMGAVYRGRHLRLSVDVAVKVMAPPMGMSTSQADNFVQRFIREAQVAAGISHQNLIRVIDVNTESNVYFLVMDFVDGESVADRLKRKGPLGEREAVELALGAAEGLAEAHRAGIVHRDIKPDNIMVDKLGRVKVADLGLAKAFSTGEDIGSKSLGLTLSQQAIGTPFYMSPEQTRSARTVGPQSDVWSLGVSLYQLVTDTVPWRDTDIADLIIKIRSEPLPDATVLRKELSAGLQQILATSLQKDPAKRYPDCNRMAEALRSHLARLSPGRGLADPAAGATRLGLEVATPPERTLTLIAASALKGTAGGGLPRTPSGNAAPPPAGTPAPAPAFAQPTPAAAVPTPVTIAAAGGAARWVVPVALSAVGLIVVGIVLALVLPPLLREKPRAAYRGESGAGPGESVAPVVVEPDDAARSAHLLAAARTFMNEGLLDRAKADLVEALSIDPDNDLIKQALKDVRAKADAEQATKTQAEQYRRWLDEGFKLQLSGKIEEAAQAYRRAAEVAPAGSTEAAERAAACSFEHNVARAKEAEAAGNRAAAVEAYGAALAAKVDATVAKALKENQARLETEQAEAVRRTTAERLRLANAQVETRHNVAGALSVAEKLENQHASSAAGASLADQAARDLARLKALPADQAAAKARSCLARYFGTPSAAEIEKIAFGGEGGGP